MKVNMDGVVKVVDMRQYRVTVYETIRKCEKKVKGLSVEVKWMRPEYAEIAWKKSGKVGSFKVRVVEFDDEGHIAVDGYPSRGDVVLWFVVPKPFDDCCSTTVEGAISGVITGFLTR